MEAESFFKTSKEYLSLLPLSKWTRETIEGKLLNDITSKIVYPRYGRPSPAQAFQCPSSSEGLTLMCTRKKDGTVIVEEANRQVKEIFKAAEVRISSSLDLEDFEESCLLQPKKKNMK